MRALYRRTAENLGVDCRGGLLQSRTASGDGMMTVGIKYISYANSSGYGLAAVAYLRGLHNAGVPVWWQPSFLGSPADTTWRPEHGLPQLPLARAAAGGDSALADLPALAHGLTRKIPYDTVIMHTVPEHWPRLAEPGKRNIGYTVWETDALPRHWPPLLATADKVLVPCAMNVSIFSQGGVANVQRGAAHPASRVEYGDGRRKDELAPHARHPG